VTPPHLAPATEPSPQAANLVLTAALAHYLDRPHGEAGSRHCDDILRVAIAGELAGRR
jgi:hypothetical protein